MQKGGKVLIRSTKYVLIHHKGAVRGVFFIYAGLQNGKGSDAMTIETGFVTLEWRSSGHIRIGG